MASTDSKQYSGNILLLCLILGVVIGGLVGWTTGLYLGASSAVSMAEADPVVENVIYVPESFGAVVSISRDGRYEVILFEHGVFETNLRVDVLYKIVYVEEAI